MSGAQILTLRGRPTGRRGSADPDLLREAVASRLQTVNNRYGALLDTPFEFDVDGCVVGRPVRPRYLPDLLQALDLGAEPLAVSWGVGWGARHPAAEADPAAEALSRGRADGRWVTVAGLGEERDLMLNALLLLLQVFRQGWTARQRAAVAIRWRHLTQKAAARELDVEKSLMSRRLKSAHYAEWREGMLAVRLLLKYWLEDAAAV